ncbi:hypothetical protein NXS08_07230 [Gleimia sp. 6138-11-ORH1]|uniref:hypothetical protein n=1 Tax=Gleimia sp. 6138-11-ORH1 TaxID=2973937 RepID=UPI0021680E06|nr:hypothetical protein [Gleimia sp. 6138-11-ORH1]MCS4485257.1 hypothetical protein [Gleimia sp. 6138-11-ORH1]
MALETLKTVPSKVTAAVKNVSEVAGEFKRITDFASAIDVMTEVPQDYIANRVNALRLEHPEATPEILIEILGQRFRRSSAFSAGATGAVATLPGLNTIAGLGVSSAQFIAYLGQAGLYVLSVAHVYGIPTEEREHRRLLVMSSILGAEATELVNSKLGFSSLLSMRSSFQQMNSNAVTKVNAILLKRFGKRQLQKGTTSILGKVLPFGIGVGVGWYLGHTLAHQAITGTRDFLGPAPATFSFPVIPRASINSASEVNLPVVEALSTAPETSRLPANQLSK